MKTAMMKYMYLSNIGVCVHRLQTNMSCCDFSPAQTAELISIKARTNVTENQVEVLKRDGEGKTDN